VTSYLVNGNFVCIYCSPWWDLCNQLSFKRFWEANKSRIAAAKQLKSLKQKVIKCKKCKITFSTNAVWLCEVHHNQAEAPFRNIFLAWENLNNIKQDYLDNKA
jgi:hypothetical protein